MFRDPLEVYRKRMVVLIACCALLAGAVAGRALQIQVLGDRRLAKMADRQFRSTVLVMPRRGLVLDRNGATLAVNKDSFSVAANAKRIKDKKKIARILSSELHVPAASILRKLTSGRSFVWVERHISDEQALSLQNRVRTAGNADLRDGLWLVKENKRVYPHGETAAHILGGVNIDSEGIEGVELWQNEKLTGKGNRFTAVRDALGRSAFIDAVSVRDIKDGENVTLTIDTALQFEVEAALKEAVVTHDARGGSAIVMNAVTGEILALANRPAFNANDRSAPTENRRNRSFTDGFEPGSVIKPILLAAALSAGYSPNFQIFGGLGQFHIQGRTIREAEAHERFGNLAIKDMVRVSSNVVAAKLALQIGAARYNETLRKLGFGSKTAVGFPGEISGVLADPKTWSPIRLANLGFGHGLMTTAIQMARAYAPFANGGWFVEPSLVRSEVPGDRKKPERIFSRQIVEEVTQALEAATSKTGTGSAAVLPGFRVAGKTGTAQLYDQRLKSYSRKDYIASFVGFPVQVDPKLVIAVSLDRPMKKYYGAETAAPVFREVLRAAVNRLGLPVDEKLVGNDSLTVSVSAPERVSGLSEHERERERRQRAIQEVLNQRLGWVETDAKGKQVWRMPSLTGLSSREVVRLLEGHEIALTMKGDGVVREQVPSAGTLIRDGGRISVQLDSP